MKVLITGANGFLGTYVVNIFNQSNVKLDLFTPTSKEVNLLNFNALVKYCNDYNINTILHMAAVCAGIGGNAENPGRFLYTNTQMALNIYEAARVCKISYVYSLGSVCMYPKFCPTPFKEDDIWNGLPEETNAPYAQGKRTLMMLGHAYRQQYGIGGAHLIPVNMYGPYDHFNTTTSHVIPALITKFINAKTNNLSSVECWGTKNSGTSREFLYAEDCAEVIAQIVLSKFDNILPINIGTGEEIKIVDLANMIAELVGYNGDIIYNGRLDGQPRRCLDISRAKKLLNWEAKTLLRDGLIETIRWYKKESAVV